MELIIGLGNPGEKYKNNRHNVGFMVADRLQTTVYGGCEWEENNKLEAVVCRPKAVDVLLAKPQTFMNSSGRAVKKLVTRYKLRVYESLYVVHDDLDIPLGQYKIQFGKGPKVHNGVTSIEEHLGTKDFWRVRVGIENREWKTPNSKLQIPNRVSGEEYVLEDFGKEEQKIVNRTISKIIGQL